MPGNEQNGNGDETERNDEIADFVSLTDLILRDVPGQNEDQADLDEFRRLKGQPAQGKPALRPVGDGSEKQHQNQQRDDSAIDPVGVADHEAVIHGNGDAHDKETHPEPVELLHEKGFPSDRGQALGGAVEIEYPSQGDEENQKEEHPVEVDQKTTVYFHPDPPMAAEGSTFPPAGGFTFSLPRKYSSRIRRAMGAATDPPPPPCSTTTTTAISGSR